MPLKNEPNLTDRSIGKVIDPPAMGERRARWGYGYQDKVATAQILDLLRADLRDGSNHFEGVRLADLDAGRVDDFVLVLDVSVQGNSIKWSANATPLNWGELIGANGLIHELADGWSCLCEKYPDKKTTVQLQTNRLASSSTHPSQLISDFSVTDFFAQHWAQGPSSEDSDLIAAAWKQIASAACLSNEEFSSFVEACYVRFGYPQPPHAGHTSQDERNYLRQFGDLHKAIATWLTDNPKDDFIDRTYLLDSIGVSSFRSGLIQRFPLPEISYERNVESAEQVERAIASTVGGYIAITGPAGVGKSTLVQDVLSEHPFFIPYFAFLPDGIGNPRDRGEALTFFQDVITRLDRFFEGRRSLGVANLQQGREALRDHMGRASALFQQTGRKAILLIDGLDHIQREAGLENPLAFELPRPDEVPDGFLIILSSQPQALLADAIERHISAVLSTSPERCIPIDGLSRTEVHAIAQESARALSFEDAEVLFSACQGNPLILTYLFKYMTANPQGSALDAVAAIGNYSGDMDLYYRAALAVPLRRQEVRSLLALISRTVSPLPLIWITLWPERASFEDLYQTVLSPFVRVDSGSLYFIHNSLLAFLKAETRSVLPGSDTEADEREYHRLLAERCGDAPCSSPIGQAKVFHLFRAGLFRELLDLLTFSWLKEGVDRFVPNAEVRPILLQGMTAAWRVADYGEVLRFIFLEFDLGQRTSRVEATELAHDLLSLRKPLLAASQIRSAGRILVEDKYALPASADLQRYAVEHDESELAKVARAVYLQSKPLNLIYRTEPIDRQQSYMALDLLRPWVKAAVLFESPKNLLKEIGELHLSEESGIQEDSKETVKASLLYRAIIASLNEGFPIANCLPLMAGLVRLQVWPLYFAALLEICSLEPNKAFLRKLKKHHVRFDAISELNLKYAELLFRVGKSSEALEVCSRLEHIRIDAYRDKGIFGLSDISYTVRLRRLQYLLDLDIGETPGVTDEDTEAIGRVEAVARDIGLLFAQATLKKSLPDMEETFRSLLLFHNRPIKFPHYGVHSTYKLVQSKLGVYRRIAEVAKAFGQQEMMSLAKAFLSLVEGAAGAQFNGSHRRLFAEFFFLNNVLDTAAASRLGLSQGSEAGDDDPADRQRVCLEIAVFLQNLGDEGEAKDWLDRAGTVTAGAGNHKDYHMTQLADWLLLASRETLKESTISLFEKFLRALDVAGGAGASRATVKVLKHLASRDPARAAKLAIELVDREMLDVAAVLEALLSGAAETTVSIELLMSIFCELLAVLDPSLDAQVVLKILRLHPTGQRIDAARRLALSIRTQSFPRTRLHLLRALEEAIAEDGLGTISLTDGLAPERDTSTTEQSYYKLADGERLTRFQIISRLNDPDRPDLWNPNPSENEQFDWWYAIREVKAKDIAHAEKLIDALAVSDYRKAETLIWKSRVAADAGATATARKFAESALEAAEDGSWFKQMDGAKLRLTYGALMSFDCSTMLQKARDHFGRDLSTGKFWSIMLLDDAPDIFTFLQIDWPKEPVLRLIEEHVNDVLSVSRSVAPFSSLTGTSESIPVESGLIRFVLHLLAFPVVDIGFSARRALGRYMCDAPSGLSLLLDEGAACDVVQFEHLLAAVHIAAASTKVDVHSLQAKIEALNTSESIAVRAIARRICTAKGWSWIEIRNETHPVTIMLSPKLRGEGAIDGVIGFDQIGAIVIELADRIVTALEQMGTSREELESELLQIYWKLEKNYQWSDEAYLAIWRDSVNASFWLSTRAIAGREASMRLLGTRALSGLAPERSEEAYDFLYPIYDPRLEQTDLIERPLEMRAMDWDTLDGKQKRWLDGEEADTWAFYPNKIGDLHILGERTLFTRPDWEWPREERYRGMLSTISHVDAERSQSSSSHELTYETYLAGHGQDYEQIVIWNSERQLVGATYRWIAFNAKLARSLGWQSSALRPFEWTDAAGNLMVKSIFWKDGWVGLKPPHMESLGEGWLVVGTDNAVRAIQLAFPKAFQHLWVERHSNGRKPCEREWHLVSSLCDRFAL